MRDLILGVVSTKTAENVLYAIMLALCVVGTVVFLFGPPVWAVLAWQRGDTPAVLALVFGLWPLTIFFALMGMKLSTLPDNGL